MNSISPSPSLVVRTFQFSLIWYEFARFYNNKTNIVDLAGIYARLKPHKTEKLSRTLSVSTIPSHIKALANEDTLLPTQMFPRLPARATFVADTNFVSGRQKKVSDFVQKHFVPATNVSQFAQPKTHHEQQCVRNKVSSFASTLTFHPSKKDQENKEWHSLLSYAVGEFLWQRIGHANARWTMRLTCGWHN